MRPWTPQTREYWLANPDKLFMKCLLLSQRGELLDGDRLFEAFVTLMPNWFILVPRDDPKIAEANAAIGSAILHAATLPNWHEARAYVQDVQEKCGLGATDSQSDYIVVEAINHFFPDDRRDRWGQTDEEANDPIIRSKKMLDEMFEKMLPKKRAKKRKVA